MVCSRSTVLWSGYSNGAMVSACRCDGWIVSWDMESRVSQWITRDSQKIEEGLTGDAKRLAGHKSYRECCDLDLEVRLSSVDVEIKGG